MNNWIRSIPFNPYRSSSGQNYPEKAIGTTALSYGVDEVAAFNAFVQHWQQIREIFNQTKVKDKVSCDDVTAVINHFGQMINFLLVDLRQMISKPPQSESRGNDTVSSDKNAASLKNERVESQSSLLTPIFDHFLGERVLQSVLQWSILSGEFFNVMQLEMLKVYETLLSNSHPEILMYKPITEPLLELLESCSGCVPLEVEKRLVVLLNQLWVSLIHDQHLLKYFFLHKENQVPRFQIFSLLLPFIHREGGVGQQARDALLLSMSLSASHCGVADFIFHHSNFCPVLAAGLSGLYSMLPRSLNIRTDGWYRISPDDVVTIPPLQMFLNSLGFCNAIVQIAHPAVQKQLVDYLYQGFLVPVVGRALVQNVLAEVVAAIVYMEFFVQSVTEEKLRRAFLALLLYPQEYSELPLLTSILSHLHSSNVQLTLVTLNLFNTLIQLHSEDAMIALVFQYLTPCNHVMLSQRSKLSQLPFSSSDRFLRLLPAVCQIENAPSESVQRNGYNLQSTQSSTANSGIVPSRPVAFSVYLHEAQRKVAASYHACSSWVWSYNAQSPLPTEAVHLINAAKLIPVVPYAKPRSQSDPSSFSLPYERADTTLTDKKRSSSLPDYSSKKKTGPLETIEQLGIESKKPKEQDDSLAGDFRGKTISHLAEEDSRLTSLGGSSGYESINLKSSSSRDTSPRQTAAPKSDEVKDLPDKEEKWVDNDESFIQFLEESPCNSAQAEDDLQFIEDFYEAVGEPSSLKKDSDQLEDPDSDLQSIWLTPSLSSVEDESSGENKGLLASHPKPSIGPFLEALISQIDNIFLSNTDASLLAMSCISNLASYPCPLLTSLLLQPSVVLQPAVRSLYQVLGQLKQKIDSILTPKDFEIISDARQKIYQSVNADSSKEPEPASSPSSFVRGGEKRRSFSQTMSALFKRNPPIEKNLRTEGLMNLPGGSGYRYINTPTSRSPFLEAPTEKRQAAICTLLLEEWLHELAALAEEHTVFSASLLFKSLPNTS